MFARPASLSRRRRRGAYGDDVAEAVETLRRAHPETRRFVVKLDDGVGGLGNAMLEPPVGSGSRPTTCSRCCGRRTRAAPPPTSWPCSRAPAGSSRCGSTARRWRAPACSCAPARCGWSRCSRRTTSSSAAPAARRSSAASSRRATSSSARSRTVGDRRELARRGVVGRFAVDFVMVRRAGGWHAYAIEINLRNGGTTHPALTLLGLTDGTYNEDTGPFQAGDGPRTTWRATTSSTRRTASSRRTTCSTDRRLRPRLGPRDAGGRRAAHGLGGRGRRPRRATAIGRTREEARDLFDRTRACSTPPSASPDASRTEVPQERRGSVSSSVRQRDGRIRGLGQRQLSSRAPRRSARRDAPPAGRPESAVPIPRTGRRCLPAAVAPPRRARPGARAQPRSA